MMKLKDILLEVEADQKVDAVVDDLKDDFASALNGIEDALEDAEDQQKEGVLTTASLLLALPAVLGIIARLGKAATSAFQKIAGKKPPKSLSAAPDLTSTFAPLANFLACFAIHSGVLILEGV